jgi:hypothetical protein
VVALSALLNNARQTQALTYNPTPMVIAALMYLALLWPIVRLLSRLEHRSVGGADPGAGRPAAQSAGAARSNDAGSSAKSASRSAAANGVATSGGLGSAARRRSTSACGAVHR